MQFPSVARRAVPGVFGPIAALVVAPLIVVQASNAAFTDTTDNTDNLLSAATVVLSDDDSDTAMFNVTNMVPGDSATECITVTYSGSTFDLNPISFFGGMTAEVGDFGDYIELTVEEGTGGSFGDCTGFTGTALFDDTLAVFDQTAGFFAFTPAEGDVSRTYRMTAKLADDTPETAQAGSATAIFTWEARTAA